MASIPHQPGPGEAADQPAWRALAPMLVVAMAARIAAAFVVQWLADRAGKPCLFDDTVIYRALGHAIATGAPFVVFEAGGPHYALRTPGYPAFLAGCELLFGPGLLAVRIVQGLLGTIGVALVSILTKQATGDPRAAAAAGWLAALEPYGIGVGALILSEGIFIPLMLAGMCGLAATGRRGSIAAATGALHGLAILVKPSWALFVPMALGSRVFAAAKGRRVQAIGFALIAAAATALVLAPWWVRNARIFGRFVPTALWVGASLYDGVSPTATGASEMTFLQAPGIVELDEVAQDRKLRDRAQAFAWSNPGRVAVLAAIKVERFWSPWPNAESLRSAPAAIASACVTIPLFALTAIGAWRSRYDARALALLAGPLVYFMVLHAVFVSSIRYRIPGFFPALGLAGCGWVWVRRAVSNRK